MDMQNLLDSLLQKGLQQGCFPGAIAACGDREHVYALSRVGKIAENGPEVTEETRYDMASLSKVLGTTMVAFKALENGDISLYDKLPNFFDDVPEDKKEISIYQLMTHTAGFNPSFRLDQLVDSPDKALRAILDSKLAWDFICAMGDEDVMKCIRYLLTRNESIEMEASLLLKKSGCDAARKDEIFAKLETLRTARLEVIEINGQPREIAVHYRGHMMRRLLPFFAAAYAAATVNFGNGRGTGHMTKAIL